MMHRMKVLLVLTGVFISLVSVPAQVPLPPEAKGGIFDFDDVPAADQEKAKEEMKKQELEADASLPQNVRDMLDRLTQYQLILEEITQRRVQPLRQALKERLAALVERSSGEEKVSAQTLADYVTALPLSDALNAAAASSEPAAVDSWVDTKGKHWNTFLSNTRIKRNWTDGRWSWQNRQKTILLVDYWGGSIADVVILASPMATEADVFNSNGERWKIRRNPRPPSSAKKAGGEGLRFIQETAAAEQGQRDKSAAELASRKAAVLKWLGEQAKTATPAVAAKIRSEAFSINPAAAAAAAGAGRTRAKAHYFGGVWAMQDGRRMELKPDGAVTLNGKPAGASWDWCKDRNSTTALIKFGSPDAPSDVWIIRRSSSEDGVIRVATRSSYATAKRS
nr:unknown Function [uncultured bacterium]